MGQSGERRCEPGDIRVNDNGDCASARSDPFWLGMAAFRDHIDRLSCPFPEAHVEARSWAAGWDHGAFRADEPEPVVAEAKPVTTGKRWSDIERAVLLSLARGGEALTSLSARMGRPVRAIEQECDRLGFELTDDQRAR